MAEVGVAVFFGIVIVWERRSWEVDERWLLGICSPDVLSLCYVMCGLPRKITEFWSCREVCGLLQFLRMKRKVWVEYVTISMQNIEFC